MAYQCNMVTKICVNIGLGNSLLPDGSKPLPETMLSYHQWGSGTIIWGKFHKSKYQCNQSNCISNSHNYKEWCMNIDILTLVLGMSEINAGWANSLDLWWLVPLLQPWGWSFVVPQGHLFSHFKQKSCNVLATSSCSEMLWNMHHEKS